ncbi:hypothetical protein [Marinomonas aquimarina]|nr:hypothetical protein [Marinomonas aquimarina]
MITANLLPNEPKITNLDLQAYLTHLHLQPIAQDLERLFLILRSRLDTPLAQKQPSKLGKPYPLGQCLEISQAFAEKLAAVNVADLKEPAMQNAFLALQKFTKSGGELRQVWGDLRGDYFQNAFILGVWYVDVANDTVNPNKPSVEILPFAESGLRPIQNFAHFAVIAKRYWKAVCLPNLIYPELAPFFPLIVLQPNAAPQLHGMFDYMIALTMGSEFRMSEEALKALPFPEHLYAAMAAQKGMDLGTAREQSLAACSQARALGHHLSEDARHRAIQNALQVNHSLKALTVRF